MDDMAETITNLIQGLEHRFEALSRHTSVAEQLLADKRGLILVGARQPEAT